jgi:hypothetical protein
LETGLHFGLSHSTEEDFMFEPVPPDEQTDAAPADAQRMGSSKLRTYAVGAILALAALGAGAYSIHERSIAESAKQQDAAMVSSLQATSAQVEQLKAKLDEMSAPKPPLGVSATHTTVRPPASAHHPHIARRVARDDPRWKKMQSQLDDQGNAINSTRSDLAAAKTELGDSIARTHAELVVLQRKGERNYYEFDINKLKGFSTFGSMGIRLRKANSKHQYADLELLVDDRSLTKKHVNLYEPATFYSADSEQPIQVVINSINKDHIHGYVSEPKYRRGELTAQQNSLQPDATQGSTPQVRQKLTVSR